jgi:hypothetical protein
MNAQDPPAADVVVALGRAELAALRAEATFSTRTALTGDRARARRPPVRAAASSTTRSPPLIWIRTSPCGRRGTPGGAATSRSSPAYPTGRVPGPHRACPARSARPRISRSRPSSPRPTPPSPASPCSTRSRRATGSGGTSAVSTWPAQTRRRSRRTTAEHFGWSCPGRRCRRWASSRPGRRAPTPRSPSASWCWTPSRLGARPGPRRPRTAQSGQ